VPMGTPGASPEPGASGTAEPPTGATATPVVPEPTKAPPTPTTAPAEGVQHVVALGETVETIASLYGVTAAEIIAANNLTNPNLIRVGDVLIIPGVTTPASRQGVHVVSEGETLGYIASLYGVTAEAIAAANGIVNENLISVGQTLIIPGGSTSQSGGQTYVVQEGDTLSTIAAALGTTEQAIINANNLANANMIYVGQTLLIP
jgi:LysM repeat protein